MADYRTLPPPYRRHTSSSSTGCLHHARPLTAPAAPHPRHQPTPPLVIVTEQSENSHHLPKRPRLQHKSRSFHTLRPTGPTRQKSFSRPLPPVPPMPTPPCSTPVTPRSALRPLPNPPPLPPTPVSAPVTYSRPLPPPRWASLPLKVQTSPAALMPKSPGEVSFISPVSPVPPSPMTVKKRRMAKLRRHLGQSLPQEVVYGSEDSVPANDLLKSEREIKSRVIFETDYTSGSEDDDDASEAEVESRLSQQLAERLTSMGTSLNDFQPRNITRYSRRWMREKDGRRWVEHDLQDVLRQLREL